MFISLQKSSFSTVVSSLDLTRPFQAGLCKSTIKPAELCFGLHKKNRYLSIHEAAAPDAALKLDDRVGKRRVLAPIAFVCSFVLATVEGTEDAGCCHPLLAV